MRHSFGSFSNPVKIALGSMAKNLGKRPSDFLSWNDETEWDTRLIFDMDIMAALQDAEVKAHKKAMRRR